MEQNMVQLTIDGRGVSVPAGTRILDACAAAGVRVPTLCHLPEVSSNASCGVCVVEVEGAKSLVRSCVQNVGPGMVIKTNSPRVQESRRTIVELLLANHPADCLSCARNGSCELQALSDQMGVRRLPFPRTRKKPGLDDAGYSLVRDNDKCILCGRCVAVCRETQTVSAIDFAGRGIRTRVSSFMDRSLANSQCVSCGQCTVVCPTGALVERDETDEIFAALADPDRVVVVQTAPAIRASLGEALGMKTGSLVTGKMAAALRRLGFDKVFDTQFTADLTIMEEGSELISRLTNGGKLPMITSCSPGWITFIETFYPSLLPHLSTCKSPQQMFGSLAKSYWAEKAGVDPSKITVVSIMPCTAKKFEAKRPEMRDAWKWWKEKGKTYGSFFDVDYALTTRELARMIRRAGIDFELLPDEDFDDPLGASTGAATIFGTTGGVMEAAVRTAYELVTKKPFPVMELQATRGMEGIKSAELDLEGTKLKVAVAHTLKNARAVLEEIAAGKSPYAFVEVMTCPGGCIGGGGQPVAVDQKKRATRQKAVYEEDKRLPIRKSHENPSISAIYKEFLGKPLGHLSHELLHTEYKRRDV
ncbi:MAG TPA: NADH-dependent [FeFe] hydrogenase, group A6 [Spirochaetia bacterium]|nr:NADH-dependent [FeFe] hydrogenase, group A6 [Spirochaetales bacterium]HRY80375.1 NADH-dependent [FeFe] hydrogenase, group A6 [Spirochaetia bacterium]HRZ88398.1 NADH-dependent [FeFe] hydrogenase, group A6 [Spirochaetia bacterium]